MPMSISARSPARAGRARTEQEDAVGRIRHMPRYYRSGEFGGVHRASDCLLGMITLPQDLNKSIGGEFAIRARDIEMRDRANGTRGKG
jgi:hypothetical protein